MKSLKLTNRVAVFLSTIQSIWPILTELNVNSVNPTAISDGGFSLARCFTTRFLLTQMLTGKQQLQENQLRTTFDLNTIFTGLAPTIYVYSLSGSLFPDHTFILITFQKKVYILQSYYNMYMFNSVNGLLELELDEFKSFANMINFYVDYSNRNRNLQTIDQQLLNANKLFEHFTGVSSSGHGLDILSRSRGENKVQLTRIGYHSADEFIKMTIKNLKNYLDNGLSYFYNNQISALYIEIYFNAFTSLVDRRLLVNMTADAQEFEDYTGLKISPIIITQNSVVSRFDGISYNISSMWVKYHVQYLDFDAFEEKRYSLLFYFENIIGPLSS